MWKTAFVEWLLRVVTWRPGSVASISQSDIQIFLHSDQCFIQVHIGVKKTFSSVVATLSKPVVQYSHRQCIVTSWTYYKWTYIVSLMNSCTCLCQKYHNDILNMLPSFDLITTAATLPEKNQNSSLRNLQNACAEENKSLKLWKVYDMCSCAI